MADFYFNEQTVQFIQINGDEIITIYNERGFLTHEFRVWRIMNQYTQAMEDYNNWINRRLEAVRKMPRIVEYDSDPEYDQED